MVIPHLVVSPLQASKITDISWSAAYALIPWWTYWYNADTAILKDNYAKIHAFMSNLVPKKIKIKNKKFKACRDLKRVKR